MMDDADEFEKVYFRISNKFDKSDAKAASLKRNIIITSMLLTHLQN